MPNTKQIRMEDMSVAYLTALCAANGYNIYTSNHDNEGVDRTISCKDFPAEGCLIKSARIDIQLKSSSSPDIIWRNDDGSLSYRLEVKNYESLRDVNRAIPLILVVLYMHNDENLWIEHNIDFLKITRCAYWISLRGWKPTKLRERISITIPAENLLTKESLKEIMIKVAKGEGPNL